MALIGTFSQQPDESLDYDVDYTDWLTDGDTVYGATVGVTPTGLTVSSPVLVDADKRVKLWVSGGVSGTAYKVEVTATTVLGRVKQDEVRFRIREV